MSTVTLKKVFKRFGNTEVVHGIDLEIKSGELIVLVGPSGCGKSTTLRMVAGLEEISDGEILIGDRVVNDVAPKDRSVAMVFQNYALYPHMSVFDNMSFGLRLKKTPKSEIKERVTKAAKILNIESYLERKPSELSGGQRQRVAMGRAIVRNPEIFLFDEPLSNLDAKLRTQMRVEIKELHQRVKNTIIYVTHDQIEAMTLGDRIVVMRDGYIEQDGEPIELYENPANSFVAGFIGNPPMNLLNGEIIAENSNLKIAVENGPKVPIPEKEGVQLQTGQKVILGIRPDEVTPKDESSAVPDEWIFNAKVDVTEPLGNETHVHLEIEKIRMTGICEGRTRIKPGQNVDMAFNLERLHIFDAQSTQSIY